ncbi:MAG: serine hydrolase domain-containing protein [Spirochaetia bacterium]|jgi:CubicO group peptidase (beta-lactamase class C family)
MIENAKVSPQKAGFDAGRLGRLSQFLDKLVGEGKIAGAAAMVVRDSEVAFREYVGFADAHARNPLRADTLYRLFSMSKPITCAAALGLWERGLYGLDDPVDSYIPAFRSARVLVSSEKGEVITTPVQQRLTIRHLFTHTSGIVYPSADSEIGKIWEAELQKRMRENPRATTGEVIDGLASLPLAFEPGSHWAYGFSHDVLGRLVEVLSRKSLGSYFQEEIFAPLEMPDTGFFAPAGSADRVASLYEADPAGGMKRVSGSEDVMSPPTFESGGAGLVGTMGDYARFCLALLSGTEGAAGAILSPRTIAMMATDQLTPSQRPDFSWDTQRGYGYGLGVRVMVDPARGGRLGSVGEFGWDGKASTWMCVDPAERLIAVLMLQLVPNGTYSISERFQRLMYSAMLP